jgi:hypothetical protein
MNAITAMPRLENASSSSKGLCAHGSEHRVHDDVQGLRHTDGPEQEDVEQPTTDHGGTAVSVVAQDLHGADEDPITKQVVMWLPISPAMR